MMRKLNQLLLRLTQREGAEEGKTSFKGGLKFLGRKKPLQSRLTYRAQKKVRR